KRPPLSKDVPIPKVSDVSKKESFKPIPRESEDKNQRSKAVHEIRPVKKAPQKTFDARDRKGLRDDLDDQGWRRKRPHHKMRSHKKEEVVIRPKELKIHLPITIKDLASEMKLKASQLVAKLFMKGVMLTLNDYLDDETTIQLLGHDFDCEITIDTTEEDRLRITDKTIKQEIQASKIDELIIRPPVIAFMGHVDHGKTSLIDAIRKSNIASSEAGDITQHIGAFKCHTESGDITILDTPGHEAFSSMRARGADVTDIIVLVIAGDEGIKAQTVEAIDQAKAAGVPILVAINKCDKPNFDADNVYRQLADKDLLPEAWGGQVITVNCSAVTKQGIKEMLEMLALQAEVLELKANPKSRARGTVIESEMHKGLGPVATVLVQNGTLNLGDAIVFAQHYARVKTMHNELKQEITTAGPSSPVKITGLSGLPEAGSEFIVVKNEKEAIEIAQKRSEGQRHHNMMQQPKRVALENFLDNSVQKKVLNLILRADVQGSVEALKNSLLKIQSKKIELNIISAAVGEVSESDVQLAQNTKAMIIGFHSQVESHAENLIKTLKVTVKLYDIIYHAVDEVRALMRSLLDKIPQENDVGSAEVKAIFKSSHLGIIAGCMVTDGTIKRSSQMRLLRNGQVIWKGTMQSLKRVKEDVREVSKGYECGIVLPNNNDIKVGDTFQAYEITYLDQEL
ncbi:MAG: translation initiation factor IF-2, partial [Verrucomicrobiota bacterium]